MLFSSIKEVASLEPCRWIEAELRSPAGVWPEGEDALRVFDLVPPRFEAYAKILHPVYEDPDRAHGDETWHDHDQRTTDPATLGETQRALRIGTLARVGTGGEDLSRFRRVFWRELAGHLGLPYGPTLSAGDLDRAWPGGSWPARLHGPDEGDLIPEQMRALVRAARAAGDPNPCYFWWSLLAWMHSGDGSAVHDRLFRGRLSALPRFTLRRGVTSPTYGWPMSRAWCVSTDWDLCFTVVDGPRSYIERVLASHAIEGFALCADDAVLVSRRDPEDSSSGSGTR